MSERRRRVGVLLPSANNVMEPELYRMSPPGITYHVARLHVERADAAGLLGMLPEVERATREVMSAGCEAVLYGCTSGSFIKGAGFDREVAALVGQHAGPVPVIPTATALLEAIAHLGLRRVAVGTPYIDEINEQARKFLEGGGVAVISLRGLQIRQARAIGDVVPEQVVELALAADDPRAEGIVLSCTNLRTTEVIEDLEKRLAKPVVTSNQASLWAVLRRLGYSEPVDGYGILLRSL